MSNQEAIEILREKIFPCVTGDWKEAVGVAISALQAQEAKTQLSAKDICVPVKDTISRQAAMDAMGKAHWAKERLMELPSAQPEIVRCKDCENWIPGYITDNDDFIPPKCGKYQQMVGHSSDDYCSHAERRTDGVDR